MWRNGVFYLLVGMYDGTATLETSLAVSRKTRTFHLTQQFHSWAFILKKWNFVFTQNLCTNVHSGFLCDSKILGAAQAFSSHLPRYGWTVLSLCSHCPLTQPEDHVVCLQDASDNPPALHSTEPALAHPCTGVLLSNKKKNELLITSHSLARPQGSYA